MKTRHITRRTFLQGTTAGAATASIGTVAASPEPRGAEVPREHVIAALGRLLIPSREGDPGYADLEVHGIATEVMAGLGALSDQDFVTFDTIGSAAFAGRRFTALSENERETYAGKVLARELGDPVAQLVAKKVFDLVRLRVLSVYYMNFPERIVADGPYAAGSQPDAHQVINPNSTKLVTGWDVAGFTGPWSWEEEEARRTYIKTIAWVDVQPLRPTRRT